MVQNVAVKELVHNDNTYASGGPVKLQKDQYPSPEFCESSHQSHHKTQSTQKNKKFATFSYFIISV